ncbi:MAG: helix-turn-helix transcriptional regulator [Candidatus Omnitrophica bacterium]|nr:helix-turn-helix transcriptional regulator [Candidatus Omnitrophota bacterium]
MPSAKLTKTFGQKLRLLRKTRKFSQEKLAEKANLHPTYIGVIERGEQSATLDTIEKLAGALNVKEKELFYLTSQEEDRIKEEIIAHLSGQNPKKLQRFLDILKALD